MKITFTLTFLFTIAILIAQPTITSSWVPNIGDKVEDVVGANAISLLPGDSGANVTWDYSDVMQDMTIPVVNFTYMDPSVSDFANLYPEADLVIIPTLGDPAVGIATFYKESSDKFELLGNSLPGTSIIYSDPQTLAEFPFSFGDSFEDDYEALINTVGIMTNISGHTIVEADAHGTIHTPVGTTTNVLRIRTETMRRDSFNIGPGSNSITVLNSINYIWVKNSITNFIGSLTISSGESIMTIPGMDPIITPIAESRAFSWSIIDVSTSVFENDSLLPFEVSSIGPNPVIDELKIKLNADCDCNLEFEVVNILGQIFHKDQTKILQGENEIAIRFDHIPEGNYFVKLNHKNNSGVFQIHKIN